MFYVDCTTRFPAALYTHILIPIMHPRNLALLCVSLYVSGPIYTRQASSTRTRSYLPATTAIAFYFSPHAQSWYDIILVQCNRLLLYRMVSENETPRAFVHRGTGT